MTAKYDLSLNKNSNFDFWLQYLTDGNTAVNLSPYNAEMQIKKYRGTEVPVVFLTKSGLTYGFTGGITSGISGPGGISLNTNYDKTGLTGGININIGYAVTDSLTPGKYFYDLRLLIGTTYAQRLLEGRLDVQDGVVL